MIACAGGFSYESLPNGQISVNGQVPLASDAGVKKLHVEWAKYASAIVRSCNEIGFPVPYFVGILMTESGGNPNACSPCEPKYCPAVYPKCLSEKCCAYGLMQFIGSTARSFGHSGEELLGNAPLAIELAAKLFKQLSARYGMDLPKIAAAYNSGGVKCAQIAPKSFGFSSDQTNGHVLSSIKFNNSFIQEGLATSDSAGAGNKNTTLAVVALASVAAIWWIRSS
jgi:hypothetical protein